MTLKVWLDDIDQEPNGWIRAYTPEEVIALISTGNVTIVSLDHDLGLANNRTGYTVVKWLEEQVFTNPSFSMPKVLIHTDNPVGRKNMLLALQSIYARLESRSA